MSRHLEDLYSIVEDKTRTWLALCDAAGLDILVTCTLRLDSEQNFLFTKVPKVTNARGGQSFHNPMIDGKSVAVDFCPLVDGKCAWNRIDLFEKAANIAKYLGFEWGGDWTSFKDYPHLQMTFGFTTKELRAGARPEPHWADMSYEYLLDYWVSALQKRYEEPVKRGELFSLLERILKKMEELK